MNASLAERFADAAGPIVVKEVRQGLRARVFAICFGLLLCACLVTALVAAAEVGEWEGQTLGPRYLTVFLWGLCAVCFFVIPYTAYRSMSREREEETWVLLALTGLSSHRIVRGKVASALTQAALYSSAGAPFMVFSYFLNGVDLITVGLEVVFAMSWGVFLTCLAVAVGTEAKTRIGRAVTHFGILALLGVATFGAMAFGAELANEGGQWVSETPFVAFVIVFPLLMLTTSVLLLEGGAAGLALASEATVKGVRRVMLGQQVLAICVGFLGCSLVNHADRAVPAIANIGASMLLVAIGFFAVSETDGFPRAQREHRNWLTAGALRGWRLVMSLLVMNTVAWTGLYRLLSSDLDDKEFYSLLAAPLYVGVYLSLAVLFGRLTPLRRMGEPVATRVAFLGVVTTMAVLSPVAAVIAGNRANDRDWNALNPIFGMINFIDHTDSDSAKAALVMLAGGFVVFGLAAWAALAVRDQERTA